MPIIATVKGLTAELEQTEAGQLIIHLATGTVTPRDEQELADVLQAVADAARIVLALRAIL